MQIFPLLTGVVCDTKYLKHETGNHPESAQRLTAIYTYLKTKGVHKSIKKIKPQPAPLDVIQYIHTQSYIDRVESISTYGGGMLDLDTVVSPETYDTALLAAGGMLVAVDAVINRTVKNAFCLVRPPGHHALPERGMGFCIFNNIAIAARYIQKKYSLQKIAIIDWDVHHGNGTQFAFYSDPSVYYFSTHQFPHYPGTGNSGETGSNEGIGFTMNVPLLPGADIQVFEEAFEKRIIPAIKEFNPDFILISSGFDAHADDPLAQLYLQTEDYYLLTKLLVSCAQDICNGRIVSTLEGGYNLDALKRSAHAHLSALMEA